MFKTQLGVSVTATQHGGSTAADCDATTSVAAAAPVNQVHPTIVCAPGNTAALAAWERLGFRNLPGRPGRRMYVDAGSDLGQRSGAAVLFPYREGGRELRSSGIRRPISLAAS